MTFFLCFLQDEQLQAVVGASGGGMIIAGTAEVLLNHFARGMDPLSSVMAPRLYHQVFIQFHLSLSILYDTLAICIWSIMMNAHVGKSGKC